MLLEVIKNYGGLFVDEKVVCCFEVDELVSWLGELFNKLSLCGVGCLLGFDVLNMYYVFLDVLLIV